MFYRKDGRRYDFVMPYRCEDAEYILVGMGSYMETAQTTIDWLREEKGDSGRLLERAIASGRSRRRTSSTRSSTPRRSRSSSGWTTRSRRPATI